ncbi:MAG: tetratricopeptide repeat protein [Candidatus Magasanikbacteria bacterium]|nr:tetratricopeptide repeat protein [Candidatus Magasanikbacteria bacterium]
MSFLKKKVSSKYDKLFSKIGMIIFLIGTIGIPLFYLPFTSDVLTLPKQLMLYFLVLVLLLVWLTKVILSKELVVKRTIFDIPIAVLFLITIVSSLLSLSSSISFAGKTDIFLLNASSIIAFILWFWLFLQLVDTSKKWNTLINTLLVSFSISAFLFILLDLPGLDILHKYIAQNTVSQKSSLFGIFSGLGAVLSLGLLSIKRKTWTSKILPAITFFLTFIVLLKVGFAISWIIFAIGAGILLVVSTSLLAEVGVVGISFNFFIFLIALLFVFFGSPNLLKMNLPVEVSLGVQPSFQVTADSFLSSAKIFLFGSGPGTFVYGFSENKPVEFNMSSIVWSTRFQYPYSSVFSLLLEFGIFGFISFLFILLLGVGSALSGWLKTRPSVWKKKGEKEDSEFLIEGDSEVVRTEVFVLVVVWLVSSIGLALAFYGIVLWWLWWWLLGAVVVSLSAVIPGLIKEKRISLHVSPQYSLALSFGFVLLVTALMVFGVFSAKIYLAEIHFTKAVRSSNIEDVELNLQKAVQYRSNYADYYVAIARVNLQKARTESIKEESNPELISAFIANAVNSAKAATSLQPKNVETWETLAVMYMNARSVVPEANDWAKDAVQRAVELEPTNPVLQWYLGDVSVFGEDLDTAEEAYKKAIELKPDYLVAYLNLSELFEAKEDLDSAISVYTPVLNLVQNNSEVLFSLGRMFYNKNEGEDDRQAELLWIRAAELTPNYSNALYSLGLLYERRGDRANALNFFKQVQEINPGNTDIADKVRATLSL